MKPALLTGAAAAATLLVWGLAALQPGDARGPGAVPAQAPMQPPVAAAVGQAPVMPAVAVRTGEAEQLPGPDVALRRLFDEGLLRGSDQPPALVRQQVEEALARKLPPPQLAAARALLGKYTEFRAHAAALDHALETATTPQALALHLQALRRLRARSFSAAEQALLFPDDEAYERYLMERAQIAHDATLDEDARHRLLQELERSVPPAVRAAENARNGVLVEAAAAR